MQDIYKYSLLKKILHLKIDAKTIWKKRIQNQTQFIHLLEDVFGTEITTRSFGFYPNKIYFGTPLTSDPMYTQKAKPLWLKIKKMIEKIGWEVYAPFDKTDPHAIIPDKLDSYQIRDLDHVRVLTAEVALFDLNRPSHGVGQEIEMGFSMPKIGFSKEKVSRLAKGMPGFVIVDYADEKGLTNTLRKIFIRESYVKNPFYLSKCANHPIQSVFRGKICLHCKFNDYLHSA